MGKWLDSKVLRTDAGVDMTIHRGIDSFRVEMNNRYYYVNVNKESKDWYEKGDVLFFMEKVQGIKTSKSNRKTTRENNKFYRKFMKKINAKNIIKEDAIKDEDSTIDDIKKEVADNLKNVLGDEKTEKENE